MNACHVVSIGVGKEGGARGAVALPVYMLFVILCYFYKRKK